MSVDQVSEPRVEESTKAGGPPSRLRRSLPTRRFALRWLPILVLSVCGLVWLLSWWSPVPVREVTIVGASKESVAAVRTAAGSLEGQALRDVDVEGITARVVELPGIQGVDLVIQRPWTVALVVDERHAFAQVEVEQGYEIVDSTGETIRVSKKKVKRIPLLAGEPGPRVTALAVVNQLPESLSRRLVSVTSGEDGRTKLTLRGGTVVELGTVDSIERKAEVIESLLQFEPSTINVSVPERPAVTGELKLPRANREAAE